MIMYYMEQSLMIENKLAVCIKPNYSICSRYCFDILQSLHLQGRIKAKFINNSVIHSETFK